jgi:hypothetical protein
MAANTKTGSYTGTGAAINIELGFIPDYIRVINITDGDDAWEWFSSMAAASAIYQRNLVDNATSGNSSMALITTNGISTYDAADFSHKKGFKVGTSLSENGKTFAYVATRNGEY